MAKQEYNVSIQPAISLIERGKIEKCLEEMGYEVLGGGTMIDMTESDIVFQLG
jgi:hypothetical protein